MWIKTVIRFETEIQVKALRELGVLQGDCGQSREGKCTERGDRWENLPDLCRVSRRCQVSPPLPGGCWEGAPGIRVKSLTLLLPVSSSCWFNVLNRVHSASPEQLMEMHHEQANPKNAVVSAVSPPCWGLRLWSKLQITLKHPKIQKLKWPHIVDCSFDYWFLVSVTSPKALTPLTTYWQA